MRKMKRMIQRREGGRKRKIITSSVIALSVVLGSLGPVTYSHAGADRLFETSMYEYTDDAVTNQAEGLPGLYWDVPGPPALPGLYWDNPRPLDGRTHIMCLNNSMRGSYLVCDDCRDFIAETRKRDIDLVESLAFNKSWKDVVASIAKNFAKDFLRTAWEERSLTAAWNSLEHPDREYNDQRLRQLDPMSPDNIRSRLQGSSGAPLYSPEDLGLSGIPSFFEERISVHIANSSVRQAEDTQDVLPQEKEDDTKDPPNAILILEEAHLAVSDIESELRTLEERAAAEKEEAKDELCGIGLYTLLQELERARELERAALQAQLQEALATAEALQKYLRNSNSGNAKADEAENTSDVESDAPKGPIEYIDWVDTVSEEDNAMPSWGFIIPPPSPSDNSSTGSDTGEGQSSGSSWTVDEGNASTYYTDCEPGIAWIPYIPAPPPPPSDSSSSGSDTDEGQSSGSSWTVDEGNASTYYTDCEPGIAWIPYIPAPSPPPSDSSSSGSDTDEGQSSGSSWTVDEGNASTYYTDCEPGVPWTDDSTSTSDSSTSSTFNNWNPDTPGDTIYTDCAPASECPIGEIPPPPPSSGTLGIPAPPPSDNSSESSSTLPESPPTVPEGTVTGDPGTPLTVDCADHGGGNQDMTE